MAPGLLSATRPQPDTTQASPAWGQRAGSGTGSTSGRWTRTGRAIDAVTSSLAVVPRSVSRCGMMRETVRSCPGHRACADCVRPSALSRKLCGRASGYQQAGVRRGQTYQRARPWVPRPFGNLEILLPFLQGPGANSSNPCPSETNKVPKSRTHLELNPWFQLCFFFFFFSSKSAILRGSTLRPHHLRTLSFQTGLAVGCRQHHCGEMREAPQRRAPCSKRATCHGWEWGTYPHPSAPCHCRPGPLRKEREAIPEGKSPFPCTLHLPCTLPLTTHFPFIAFPKFLRCPCCCFCCFGQWHAEFPQLGPISWSLC